MKLLPNRVRGLLIGAGLLLGVQASAEDAGAEGLRYVDLTPTFVTNFGYSEDGRLSYVRTDVAVQVSSQVAENAVLYHYPMIRNFMVLALSRQGEDGVSSTDGRDELREEALADIRAFLEEEEGEGHVEAILFTNFIVQR